LLGLYRVRGIAKAFKRAGKGEYFGMGERLRAVDVDLDQGGGPTRQPWSIGALGVPLPIVATLLVQTAAVLLWVGKQSDKLDTVIEQQKEIKAEVYHQNDATRDLALRDDRIAELARRVAILEGYVDGRRR
jgi:hypothetical protein